LQPASFSIFHQLLLAAGVLVMSVGLKSCYLAVVVIALAYLYSRRSEDYLKQHLDEVLSGLLRAENKVPLGPAPRVAIGFGACVDVFGDAEDILNMVQAQPPLHPGHFNSVDNLEQLEKLYAYFFRYGAAAEYVIL
jgi:ADP-dependent glucokinase